VQCRLADVPAYRHMLRANDGPAVRETRSWGPGVVAPAKGVKASTAGGGCDAEMGTKLP